MDGDSAEQTATAMTPAHTAHEQLKGETLSTATDVYALGLLLFRLLTVLLPSTRLHPVDAQFSYPQSAVKGDLDAIVAQALRVRPEGRYGSVMEFSTDSARSLSARSVRARPYWRHFLQ